LITKSKLHLGNLAEHLVQLCLVNSKGHLGTAATSGFIENPNMMATI